jgi:hypothetical protein
MDTAVYKKQICFSNMTHSCHVLFVMMIMESNNEDRQTDRNIICTAAGREDHSSGTG